MPARLTVHDVGAWLFRCNPSSIDLDALRRPGGIRARCAVGTYRVALIRADAPVVLWVTGPSGARTTPGVWMLGYATGEIEDDAGGTPSVRLRDMLPLPTPLPRAQLAAHPGTRDMEVLRQPFGPNPSYLTPAEHQQLATLIGGWPGPGPTRMPRTGC